MKKFIFIVTFMLFVPSISACDYSIKAKQRAFASNVNFDLSYQIIDDNAIFSVVITGLNDDLYVSDGSNKYYGDYIVIDNLKSGVKYKFDVYSDSYDFCSFGSLNSRTISTPVYNKYYNDSLCLDHQSDNICYRWNNVDMTYDEFKKIINTLEKDKEIVVDDVIKNNNPVNYLLVFAGFIILSSCTVLFVRRKNIGF